jgi:RHS repeat-associated protein
LAYDQANRLIAYGTSATYPYNGDGLRMSKTVSGTTSQFLWDVAARVPLLLKDGSTSYVYGPGGLPLEQINGSTALWLHHDQLGSTRLVTDNSGTSQATYAFDAYGNLTASTGTITNPLRFAAQYQDNESNLYYLRARYYDPSTAQFLSRDLAVAMTRQPYAYVRGDPLNVTDPSGLCGLWGDDTCLQDVADAFVRSDVGTIANGWANGVTFGLSSKVEGLSENGRANLAVEECRSGYKAGNVTGEVTAAFLYPAAGAKLAGAALRGVGIGTRLAIHDAHHIFGALGKLPHVQLNWWEIGVKGSGGAVRIPLPPIWPFS